MAKLQINIDSELSWMVPYLRKVQHIVDLNKVKRIRSTKYEKRVNRGSYALCRRAGKRFEIDIDKYYQFYTHHRDGSWSVRLQQHSKIDLLCLLAHELAHVVVWEQDHSPDHKMYEARMTAIFMRKLKKENYISEEDELKTKDGMC